MKKWEISFHTKIYGKTFPGEAEKKINIVSIVLLQYFIKKYNI